MRGNFRKTVKPCAKANVRSRIVSFYVMHINTKTCKISDPLTFSALLKH